jgi:hypothetical protein
MRKKIRFGRLAAFVTALVFLLSVVAGVAAATTVTLDWETDKAGNPILTGQVIDTEFQGGPGVDVSITMNGGNQVAIFDSANPTGGDVDLGTPNQDFGGPGIGTGGELGQPGENNMAHENVLIIPTTVDGNGDGFIDGDPNDSAAGGTIIFTFSEPVAIESTEVLDQESTENLTINVYADPAGTVLLASFNPSGLGDNSYEFIDISALGAQRIDYDFDGSGAIASLVYTEGEPTAVSLSGVSAASMTSALVWVAVAGLLLAGFTFVYLRRRTA